MQVTHVRRAANIALAVVAAFFCFGVVPASAGPITPQFTADADGDSWRSPDWYVTGAGNTVLTQTRWDCDGANFGTYQFRFRIVNDVTGGATSWVTIYCKATGNYSKTYWLSGARYYVQFDRLGPANSGSGSVNEGVFVG